MATGMAARGFLGPLLSVNLAMYIVVLGLAGWSLDKFDDQEAHRHLGGNTSTSYLLIFSLTAGAMGSCSVLAGLLHIRAWRSDSLASAVSSALVSSALTALSFGLACKHINLGNRGRRLVLLSTPIIHKAWIKIVLKHVLCLNVAEDFGGIYHYFDIHTAALPDPATCWHHEQQIWPWLPELQHYGVMSHDTQKDSTTTAPPDA
uniref:Membrane protein PM19L-like isoform X1 n=1 Tax=Elaeis guineensis var. tenera TaxID=51953 RepID=A0A6J0PD10_ELAGV|nr:membrane protein PM19L-like isoform X1 [Elaeis guineensis]